MKVNSLGISITNQYNAISVDDIFNYLSSLKVFEVDQNHSFKRVICCYIKNNELHGCIITFKDQKTNCIGQFKNGDFSITTDDLGDNKLINHNFFILKKSSNKNIIKGVYTQYFASCPYTRFFSIIENQIKLYIKNKEKEEIKKEQDDKKHTAIKKKNKGNLALSIIAEKQKLTKLLSELDEIKEVDFSFETKNIDNTSPLLPISILSERVNLQLTVKKEKRIKDKLNVIEAIKNISDISTKGKVKGIDVDGIEKTINFLETPTHFEQYDLDDLNKLVNKLTKDNYKKNAIYDKLNSIISNNRLIFK